MYSRRSVVRELRTLVLIMMIVAVALAFVAIHYAKTAAELLTEIEEQRQPVGEPELTPSAATMVFVEDARPVLTLDAEIEDTYLRDDLPISHELQATVYGAALEFGIDYDLALCVIEQETDYRNIIGDGGDSYGYMQVQPRWWRWMMDKIGAKDLMEPRDGIRTGCAVLRYLIDAYDGSVYDALSAYNTGHGGRTAYADSVMDKYTEAE